jgi:2-haloacid dehalogenase
MDWMIDTGIDTVVFDLGGVLLDWDPRYLYRTLLDDDAAIDAFFARVPLLERNFRDHDRGVPMSATVEELCAAHPDDAALIEAWADRYEEMMGRSFDDVVAILEALHERGVRLFALSNAPREVAVALRAYPFCTAFEGMVISGEEGIAKPDPAIFGLLVERFGIDPSTAAFVDDVEANVRAAQALGFQGIVFRSAEQLRTDLGSALDRDRA